MGTIAHVLELGGLSTISIALIRDHAERLQPPRTLYCEFPLGRPLGKPNDPPFQRSVIEAALSLLVAESGPVLEDYPETVADASDEPLSCPLPVPDDTDSHPAVSESRGLRSAYERHLDSGGRTLVGRAVGPEQIPDAVAAFVKVAEGGSWKDAGLPGHPLQWSRDITSYYEEAAAAMVGHVPAARAAESWLYQKTEAGKVLKAARKVLKEADEPFWFYLIPFTQHTELGRP